MTSAYVVSPFDGGWCLKISQTGEVMFFATGDQAERRARALAALDPGSEVWIHGRDGRLIGRWVDGGERPSVDYVIEDTRAVAVELAA